MICAPLLFVLFCLIASVSATGTRFTAAEKPHLVIKMPDEPTGKAKDDGPCCSKCRVAATLVAVATASTGLYQCPACCCTFTAALCAYCLSDNVKLCVHDCCCNALECYEVCCCPPKKGIACCLFACILVYRSYCTVAKNTFGPSS